MKKEKSMVITREEFEAYCEVQESGITNMLDIKLVSQLSDLNRNQVMFIIKNYGVLYKKYKGE